MPKHINRRRKQSAEDDWSHITGSVGEKIDDKDILDVQDRSITFKDEFGDGMTNYEIYEEEMDKTKDDLGNTAQYLKFVNESIQQKKTRMEELHEKQRKFDEAVDSLQDHRPKTKEQLDNIKYKNIKPKDVERTLQFLEREREQIKKKMEYYATQVSHSQLDLVDKDKQIAAIKAEMEVVRQREKNRIKQIEKEIDPIDLIRSKVQEMGNTEETKKILDQINELAGRLKSSGQSEKDSSSLEYLKKEFAKKNS